MTVGQNDLDREEQPLILIVDDDPDSVRLLVHQLQPAGFRTMFAEDAAMGMTIAEKYEPHLVLLDLNLPNQNGIETCEKLKGNLRLADTPVIFVTGAEKTDAVVERCFGVGGNDLLFKPFSGVELLARVRVALRERSLREAYRQLAIEDPYTGLANRRHFILNITEAILTSQRTATESVLAIADIDNLMSYNERFGHDLGDEAILTFARLFKRFCGPTCRAGRLGGEELGIVLTHSSQQSAWALCDRLRQTFAAIAFDARTSPKHFTACFGLASFSGNPANFDVDQFLLRADVALCAAKELGRNRMAAYWNLDPNRLPVISSKKRHARTKARKRGQRAFIALPPELVAETASPASPKE